MKVIVYEVNFLKNHLGKGLFVILYNLLIFKAKLISLGTIMLVSFFDVWTIVGLVLIGFGFIIISLKVYLILRI